MQYTTSIDLRATVDLLPRRLHRNLTPAVPFWAHRAAWSHHHLYACPCDPAELAWDLRFRGSLSGSEALREGDLARKRQALRRAGGPRQVYVDEKARLAAAFFSKMLGG
ncbi:MAG: hypothetical protein QME94_01315 [Anaerolineae bacterium]|nr:hypothetical protein [Anaerolineae bacterium]